jgi:SAM-dependent methyltransferase
MLAAYGQVYAIEIDEGAAVLARARGVGAVQTGGVPDALGFGDKLFDLILLLDVLEHLDADQGALHSLAARLKDGGWLMLTVPAYPFLWSHHDERNHHKRRYTMRGLLGVVRKAGYNIRFASYFNCWLFPMVALVRLLQGRVFGSPWENLNLPPSLLNTALTRIFASERYALSRHASLPFGVSLLLVAQKPQV